MSNKKKHRLTQSEIAKIKADLKKEILAELRDETPEEKNSRFSGELLALKNEILNELRAELQKDTAEAVNDSEQTEETEKNAEDENSEDEVNTAETAETEAAEEKREEASEVTEESADKKADVTEDPDDSEESVGETAEEKSDDAPAETSDEENESEESAKTAEEKTETAEEKADAAEETAAPAKKSFMSFFKKKDEEKKERKEYSFALVSFVKLFAFMTLMELVFRFVEFGAVIDLSLLRILLFNAGFAGIVSALCALLPLKAGQIIVNVLNVFFTCYVFFQIGIRNMMGTFISVKTGGNMAGAVMGYVFDFFGSLKWWYWFILLVPVFALVSAFAVKEKKENRRKVLAGMLAGAVALDAIGLVSVAATGLWGQYDNPIYTEKAVREFGALRFLLRDTSSLFVKQEVTLVADAEEKVEDTSRDIDDTAWKKMSSEDTDADRVSIDNTLMNRSVDGYNEMTGVLQDKNLIYIMIEAFDYVAVDEQLTPTLWKLQHEGWNFTNHYTPKFDSGTGDTELIAETSLIPRSDITVYNEYCENDWNDSIFTLFKNSGYTVRAYHNWKDEFYQRRTMYGNSGVDEYENYEDLPFHTIWGWQSDEEMFELTVDKYVNTDRFMTMYVTAATHFPYTRDDVLATKYLDQVNQVHPDYPMEIKRYLSKAMDLDAGMKYLVDKLEEAGKMDDTAIVFFADHHPLQIDTQMLVDCTTAIDRSEALNLYRSPYAIYCPSLGTKTFDKVESSFDILPTVANLYNLDYDPRMYLGTDYFSDREKIVYFPNGDWITDKGIYYNTEGEFAPTGKMPSEKYIASTTAKVQNYFALSQKIYDTNYFAYRKGITTPVSHKVTESSETSGENETNLSNDINDVSDPATTEPTTETSVSDTQTQQ